MLATLAIWQGAESVYLGIVESDWSKLTGPHGVAFAAVIAVIVLWGALLGYISKSRKEELAARAKDDAAGERRHIEMRDTQAAHAERLIQLTAQSITANINGTHALETLSRNMQYLTAEIKDRPCHTISKPV
jgi:hypothetical protein